MPGTIRNLCPRMPVKPTPDPNVRMTTILYGTVIITLDTGEVIYGYLRFPETAIRKTGLLTATVDQCTANGLLDGGGRIWVTLDPERVIGPEALPVQGKGGFVLDDFVLDDGRNGEFTITYPAVLSIPEWGSHGIWDVGAVEADGVMT